MQRERGELRLDRPYLHRRIAAFDQVGPIVGCPAMILRSKARAEVQKGFRGSHEQISFGRQSLGKTEEEIATPRSVEIDRDVPAEDDVEGADAGERLKQISLLKQDHGSHLVLDSPAAILLDEIF